MSEMQDKTPPSLTIVTPLSLLRPRLLLHHHHVLLLLLLRQHLLLLLLCRRGRSCRLLLLLDGLRSLRRALSDSRW